MQRQLQLCREALEQLRAGGNGRSPALPVCQQLAQQLQGWHSTRPEVTLIRHGLLEGGRRAAQASLSHWGLEDYRPALPALDEA